MQIYLVFEAAFEFMVDKINFILVVKYNDLLFQIVQHKLRFTLLLNFDMHVVEQLHVKTPLKQLHYHKKENTECRSKDF